MVRKKIRTDTSCSASAGEVIEKTQTRIKSILKIIYIMMRKNFKRIIWGVLITLGVAIICFAVYLNSLMPIITGYAAKNLCSDVFVSGRKPENIEAVDLNFSFIKLTKNSVNY